MSWWRWVICEAGGGGGGGQFAEPRKIGFEVEEGGESGGFVALLPTPSYMGSFLRAQRSRERGGIGSCS